MAVTSATIKRSYGLNAIVFITEAQLSFHLQTFL